MKSKFYLLTAVLTFVFAACNEEKTTPEPEPTDPCESIICYNNGYCVNGECQCPEQWTGPSCQDQKKPAKIRLTKITVTSFPPTTSNGGSWDPVGNTGPDIYPVVLDNNNNILYDMESQYLNNPDYTQSHTFTLGGAGFEFPDVDARYAVVLYDYDGQSEPSQYMGGVNGNIYYSTNEFPNPIVFEYGDYRFELEVVYTF